MGDEWLNTVLNNACRGVFFFFLLPLEQFYLQSITGICTRMWSIGYIVSNVVCVYYFKCIYSYLFHISRQTMRGYSPSTFKIDFFPTTRTQWSPGVTHCASRSLCGRSLSNFIPLTITQAMLGNILLEKFDGGLWKVNLCVFFQFHDMVSLTFSNA